jgi:uncharacterized PurR-regulated membrane protein YhhQ (DUF165 family)
MLTPLSFLAFVLAIVVGVWVYRSIRKTKQGTPDKNHPHQ